MARPSCANDCSDSKEANTAPFPVENADSTPISIPSTFSIKPMHVCAFTGDVNPEWAMSVAGSKGSRQENPRKGNELSNSRQPGASKTGPRHDTPRGDGKSSELLRPSTGGDEPGQDGPQTNSAGPAHTKLLGNSKLSAHDMLRAGSKDPATDPAVAPPRTDGGKPRHARP